MSYETIVVDEDRYARAAIALLVADEDIRVIGQYGELDKALATIEATAPHVVVIGFHGDSDRRTKLAFMHQIRETSPNTACLVLSAIDGDPHLRFETVEAGADGWIKLYERAPRVLSDTVKRMAQEQSDLSTTLAAILLHQLISAERGRTPYRVPSKPGLTATERAALVKRAEGASEDAIVDSLALPSVENLKRLFRHILRKFFLPEAYTVDGAP